MLRKLAHRLCGSRAPNSPATPPTEASQSTTAAPATTVAASPMSAPPGSPSLLSSGAVEGSSIRWTSTRLPGSPISAPQDNTERKGELALTIRSSLPTPSCLASSYDFVKSDGLFFRDPQEQISRYQWGKVYIRRGTTTVLSLYGGLQAYLAVTNISETNTLSKLIASYSWAPYIICAGAVLYAGFDAYTKQKTALVDANADRIYALEKNQKALETKFALLMQADAKKDDLIRYLESKQATSMATIVSLEAKNLEKDAKIAQLEVAHTEVKREIAQVRHLLVKPADEAKHVVPKKKKSSPPSKDGRKTSTQKATVDNRYRFHKAATATVAAPSTSALASVAAAPSPASAVAAAPANPSRAFCV